MATIAAAETHLHPRGPDRRRVPRGGRRAEDKPGRHPRIAIIEPYEGVRRPCARYLEHFNFDVAEAGTVDDEFTVLESSPPAVILIEAAEPASLARLLEYARAHSIPVVCMASTFPDPPKSSALPSGVLLKPFSLGAMLDEIRRVLRARVVAKIA